MHPILSEDAHQNLQIKNSKEDGKRIFQCANRR